MCVCVCVCVCREMLKQGISIITAQYPKFDRIKWKYIHSSKKVFTSFIAGSKEVTNSWIRGRHTMVNVVFRIGGRKHKNFKMKDRHICDRIRIRLCVCSGALPSNYLCDLYARPGTPMYIRCCQSNSMQFPYKRQSFCHRSSLQTWEANSEHL